ncbi:dynein heavy chain domain-containing 1-like [Brachionus plicatilis]|uniref:Dynein heavy chain domain-containing 1-like n=1 Tax=Brachionus plicatilis TaxID=10195 RepID=A0A3M7S806_BRAPC|nr:dynein heavy chain domain-containing 1-like [Brachionus plicatilis]
MLTNRNLEKLINKYLKELKELQLWLFKWKMKMSELKLVTDKQINNKLLNFSKLTLELQIELSEQINLAEQIDLIVNILNFAIIDPKNNEIGEQFISSRIKPKDEEIIEKLSEYASMMQESLDSIRKSDIAEIKSFKAPPAAVQSIAEALCYLFSKPPNFQNFIKLVNTTDFISQLKYFDLESVNDYKLTQIKKYIQMEDFIPEYVGKISKASAILCNWIICVYKYCSTKASLQIFSSNLDLESKSASTHGTLSTYLFDSSFFMFKWFLYYGDKYEETEIEVDELITKTLNFENRYILTIDDLVQIFLSNKKLKEFQSKYARAESARGRFLFDEKSKFLITDLSWFKNIVDVLSKGKTNDPTLDNIFGANVPIWNQIEK